MLTKGRQIYVEGRLRTRSYDRDGERRYVTEIVAQRVQFLGPRPNGGDVKDVNNAFPADEEIPF
jgi:single-strand DNA-binding protein